MGGTDEMQGYWGEGERDGTGGGHDAPSLSNTCTVQPERFMSRLNALHFTWQDNNRILSLHHHHHHTTPSFLIILPNNRVKVQYNRNVPSLSFPITI